jgi:hypothetical protein
VGIAVLVLATDADVPLGSVLTDGCPSSGVSETLSCSGHQQVLAGGEGGYITQCFMIIVVTPFLVKSTISGSCKDPTLASFGSIVVDVWLLEFLWGGFGGEEPTGQMLQK